MGLHDRIKGGSANGDAGSLDETLSSRAEAVADGVTGILVERGDPDGLSRAIAGLLLDPERRAAMGEAGRLRAAEVFREDGIVDALLEAYQAAAARRAA